MVFVFDNMASPLLCPSYSAQFSVSIDGIIIFILCATKKWKVPIVPIISTRIFANYQRLTFERDACFIVDVKTVAIKPLKPIVSTEESRLCIRDLNVGWYVPSPLDIKKKNVSHQIANWKKKILNMRNSYFVYFEDHYIFYNFEFVTSYYRVNLWNSPTRRFIDIRCRFYLKSTDIIVRRLSLIATLGGT